MAIVFNRERDEQGEMCYAVQHKFKKYLIPVEDYKEAVNLGMSMDVIKHHATKGKRSFKLYLNAYEKKDGLSRLKRQDRERSERKAIREEERQRKEQERLQMIENAKCRSKWFEHLAETDIFPKVVR
ncbi:hypothetical protein [Staphylococcus shinii]|uniref:hypothetical protein n=1 Tax=Staphylococcus shinii TaxID=2912228 RepID=UPI003F547F7F